MKVLLINGSPKAKGNTAFALEQMAEVFASEADMAGIQQLIDQYLAEKAYRNYEFTQADANG